MIYLDFEEHVFDSEDGLLAGDQNESLECFVLLFDAEVVLLQIGSEAVQRYDPRLQVVRVSVGYFGQQFSLEVVVVSVDFVDGLVAVLSEHVRIVSEDVLRVVLHSLYQQ